MLGIVGQHVGGFPVEHMCLSHDKEYLVTSSQDSCHFWATSQIPILAQDDDEEAAAKTRKKRKKKQKHVAAQKLAKSKSQTEDFFADL